MITPNHKVVQRCRGPRFAQSPGSRSLILEGRGWQHFDRHIALQALIVRTIDLAHAAGAKLVEQPVIAQRAADHRRILRGVPGIVNEFDESTFATRYGGHPSRE